ncbi:MAG TPA: protein-S-isoprenylcysteine O-methyltransferase, partial [Chitinophagaceae bacterium]|nr:protein-S-isoprenylcysteine O-methyltransferase [Chitinophagaceae bacterium]
MEPIILKIGYAIVLVGTAIIRYPYEKKSKSNEIINNKKGALEANLLRLVVLGMWIIPLIYFFTDIFSFADYVLPMPLHILGFVLIIPTLWLFYSSHKALGKNWSETLEIRKGHKIIDSGVYKYVRHPMYSAIFLWSIIQALLLSNYIAGLTGLLCFGLLYFL